MTVWRRYRLKDICTYIGSGTTPKSSNSKYYDNGTYYWINTGDLNNGVVSSSKQQISDFALKDYPTLRFYPKGTIIEAMYGATIGKVGMLGMDATVNQACCAMVIDRNKAIPNFVLYYLVYYKPQLIKESFGGTQPNVNQFKVSNIVICIPPLETQQKIITYLDTKLSEIDHQVSLLTSKRDAYLRLKKSIINHVVTHGLNPNVKMKDSGIEWIGEVPEHWEVKRMKELSAIGSGTTPKSGEDKYYENGIHPWLNTSDVQDCVINEAKYSITDKALNDYSVLKYYPIGTILIAMYGGGTIGNVALMNISATINQACCAIVSNEKLLLPKYLFCYLKCHKKKIISLGFGGTQVNLSQAIIAQLPVVLPPLPEQRAIATNLDDKCTKIDTIVSNLDKQISRYGDLKRSLIDEVITGKRAV